MRKMSWMVAFAFAMVFAGAVAAEEKGEVKAPAEASKLEVVTLNVKGMMCGGCEKAVSKALKAAPGVSEAAADNANGTATVKYDPAKTSPEAIAKALTGKFSAEAPKKG
jgi:copper chaperone CopZ